jgi:hypothetical protein
MPSLAANRAAEPAAALVPLLEELPEELELDELEAPPLLLLLLPLPAAADVAEELPELLVALSVEPPPHALKLMQAAAAAAMSSWKEPWCGMGRRAGHWLCRMTPT